MTPCVFFVSCLLLVVGLQLDSYSAVQIKIEPKTFSEEDASKVTITCKVNEAEEKDAKAIKMLKIARKGERAIVLLHPNNSVTYASGNEDEFPAKGYIYSDIKDSNLEMTIATPEPEDAGAYICHAQYTTSTSGSEVKDNKVMEKLTVEAQEVKLLNNTIKKLLDKVEREKEDLKKIEQKEAEDKAKVVNLEGKSEKQSKDIKNLVEKEAEVENKVKELEKKTKEQIKEITEGIDKNPKVKKLKDQVKRLLDKVETEEKDIKDLNKKKEEEVSKIKTLEITVEQQAKSIKDLTQKVYDFQRMIENFQSETKRNLDDLTRSKNSDSDSNDDLFQLKNSVDAHDGRLEELADKARRVIELENKVNDISEKLKNKPNNNEGNNRKNGIDPAESSSISTSLVAFHVTSGVGNMYPTTNQPLSFSDVSLNEGRGYNRNSGVFQAPKSGIYVFHLFLQVPCYGCKMEATIEANNVVLSRFSGGDRYDHEQHSVSAVASLKRGDIVKAVATNVKNADNSRFSLGFMKMCGFSGYLVASAADSSSPYPS